MKVIHASRSIRLGVRAAPRPDYRTDGARVGERTLAQVSWDTAIEFAAQRLKTVRERYGPQSIGEITSSRCTNEFGSSKNDPSSVRE